MNKILKKSFKKMQQTGVWLAAFLVMLVLSVNTRLLGQQRDKTNNLATKLTLVADSVDKQTGLIMAPGYTLVKTKCIRCHSPKLITDKRATRDGWQATIRWMQQTQGLENLGKAETEILDYLAKHYAPTYEGRRPPLKNIQWHKLE